MEVGNGKAGAGRGHELRAAALIKQLRRRGPTYRTTLAEGMGTSPKTLRNTIELLEEGGVLGKGKDRLWLHPDLGVVVGVDVTHTMARVAISRFDFELLSDPAAPEAQREIPITDPEASLHEIAELIWQQLTAHVSQERIAEAMIGIGLTLPGPILRTRNPDVSEKQAATWDRKVRAGSILPGWDNIDVGASLATILKRKHGLQPPRHEERRFVWVENDASAGALGVHTELRANMEDEAPDDLIYVRISNGIGAGIINKGHLVTGAHGFAGELGHVSVRADGALCSACGGRGCLETLASNRALVEQLRQVFAYAPSPTGAMSADLDSATIAATLSELHVEQFERLIEISHPAVDRALRDAGWHVGGLLATVCCVLNPSWIVLGGAMPEHVSSISPEHPDEPHRPFVTAVRDALAENGTPQSQLRLETKTWRDIRSRHQTLSPELLGALALVVDHLGDAYLLRPIERWIRTPASRNEPLSFSIPCRG
jgi:predicted NBD/HSP70 family sugar kinase